MDNELFKIKINLDNRQRVVNRKFEEEGLTDEVFEEQLEINRLRHEHNLTDECNRVFKNYVQ